ncbi:MAG: hypothetical protein MUO72_09640 [Bacteroidales bacterium]|nr:hypothetical protein [Bacteroidales bacterium]
MKELFGLKDKEGNEYKILAEPYRDGFTYNAIMPLEKEPEFKIPGWYIINNYSLCNKIVYIIERTEIFLISEKGDRFHIKYSNPATQQEIESHLRKICDEKYIGKRVKGINGFTDIISKFLSYESDSDTMRYKGEGNFIIYLYENGKFAEIISDKKKLPKTKEEFKKFIGDVIEWYSGPSSTYDLFLVFIGSWLTVLTIKWIKDEKTKRDITNADKHSVVCSWGNSGTFYCRNVPYQSLREDMERGKMGRDQGPGHNQLQGRSLRPGPDPEVQTGRVQQRDREELYPSGLYERAGKQRGIHEAHDEIQRYGPGSPEMERIRSSNA